MKKENTLKLTLVPDSRSFLKKLQMIFPLYSGILLLLICFSFVPSAISQSLGTYSNSSVVSGQNTLITPSSAPANTTNAVAYTSNNFTGILTVDPTTGNVRVTDAKPAGTYTITVKAIGAGTASTTFTLTVSNTNYNCKQASFADSVMLYTSASVRSIAIGDFNRDGKQDMAIAQTGNNTVAIKLGDGNGGFSGSTTVSVGSGPTALVLGDFNEDGKQDIATANFLGGVSISLGDGSGGFGTSSSITASSGPFSITIGDYNSDGHQDLAIANASSSNVSIRLGNGSGGFSSATSVSVGTTPTSVVTGDFNGDGKQDLAIANSGSANVSIRLGNGSGGFSAATNVTAGTTPWSLVVGDFNSDGKQDLAIANNGSSNVSIRLGDGSGGFTGSTNISSGSSSSALTIGDFNGDGKQDLAIVNAGSKTVSLRIGDGSGGFSGSTNVSVGSNPFSIALGDFNSDGLQDLVTVNDFSNKVAILMGGYNAIEVRGNNVQITDGDVTPSATDYTDYGTSTLTRTFTVRNTGNIPLVLGSNAVSITGTNAADFTVTQQPTTTVAAHDSTTFTVKYTRLDSGIRHVTVNITNNDCEETPFNFDISIEAIRPTIGTYANVSVVAANNLVITPGSAPGHATNAVAYTSSNFTGVLTVDPTTGNVRVTDAKPAGTYTVTVKAIGAGTASTTFTLTVNNTNYNCQQVSFSDTSLYFFKHYARSVAVGDFNRDGKQDFAVAQAADANVAIKLGDGNGRFSGSTTVSVGSGPYEVVIGDFNEDGKQDIATANFLGGASISLGDGNGGFGTSSFISASTKPYALAVGDYNSDGHQDLVIANSGSHNVSIRLGDGNGGFSSATNVSVGTTPNAIVTGDFNMDGKQDFATSNYGSANVSIRLGDGSGGFSAATNVSAGTAPWSIVVGDFNSDGKQDLAIANNVSETVSIRLGDGSGGFTGSTNISVGRGPSALTIGDFNGDGKQDFAVANSGFKTVSVKLGDGSGGFSGSTDVNVIGNPTSLTLGDFNADGMQDLATINDFSGSLSVVFGGYNAIEVRGNNLQITNGDNTPSSTDYTDFSSSTLTRTFTVRNTGNIPLVLGSNAVSITGTNAADFTVTQQPTTTVAAHDSTTFTVKYTRLDSGIRHVTVNITNNDCEETPFNFDISIEAIRPTIGTYANVSVVAGNNLVITPGSAPSHATNAVAYTSSNFTGVLTVDPTTGNVRVTDAKPAGTYTVTVKAIGAGTASTTFTLTVNNTNYNCQQVSFSDTSLYFFKHYARSVAVGDFNRDGKQDFAVAQAADANVAIKLGDGNGRFSGSTTVSVGSGPYEVVIGDFNEDGKQDIATANFLGGASISLGDGNGGFGTSSFISASTKPYALAVGDYNSDGHQDLVIANSGSHNVSIRLGDGNGGFSSATNVSVGTTPNAIVTGDFNMDGKQDFATSNYGSANVSIRLGDGSGGFSAATNVSAGTAPWSIVVGDFNSDGKQDLAIANNVSETVSIRLGDGSGGFTGSTNISVGRGPSALTIGDFNGDGKQDFAVANSGFKTVSVKLGDGSGGFSGSTDVNVIGNPTSLTLGDFNADGMQDLATINDFSGSLSVVFGTFNDIEVRGNNLQITNGDNTPSSTDYTDFSSSTLTRTFKLHNKGNKALVLGSNAVSITGTNATDFTVTQQPATTLAAQDSTSFIVAFIPSSLGNKSANIHVASNDCDEADYTFAVAATAIAGEALHINGAYNYVTIADSVFKPGTGDFTLETKIKIATSGAHYIMAKRNVCNYDYFVSMQLINGEINFEMNEGDPSNYQVLFSQSTDLNDDSWHHIAVTRVSGLMSLYIDGTLEDTITSHSNPNNNQPMLLGSSGPCNTYFDGQMDEVRIWNKGVSQCDIQAHMNCELIGNEPGLTAYYQFNQGIHGGNNSAVTTLYDLTTNNFDGTLNNFALTGATSNWVAPGAVTTGVSCIYPSVPTLTASQSSFCGLNRSTLSISSGNLGNATHWQWYSGSCGGTSLGSGTSISVSPLVTTTYYARAEDGCTTPGTCNNITITVTGPGVPTGDNVYTGNITINTQTQMDTFYNRSNGKKWSKIAGLLTINGNHYSDPITSLCNLSSLVEITGNLNINNFNKAANPTSLSQLANLTTLGCGLNITSNSLLQDATLVSLSSIGCSVNIKDNSALKSINLPNLASVQGGQFNIKNNPKLELASASTAAGSFSFTGKGSSIDISDNGSTAANALVMNFKKVTTLKGALVFNNNDNTGVSNFDNIFTGLTDLSTKWGKLTITNNDYLGTCCIAASVNVGGSGNRHIISGNTGNCADSATVLANCGVFHKKSSSKSGLTKAFVEYNVYPNPSSGIFNLNVMSNQPGQLNLTITDLMGRTILTESHTISQYTSLPISLTSAARGTYFLKAEMNGQVFVKRILLDK